MNSFFPSQAGTIYRVTAQTDRFSPGYSKNDPADIKKTKDLAGAIVKKSDMNNDNYACYLQPTTTSDRLLVTGALGKELFKIKDFLSENAREALFDQLFHQARFTLIA